MTNPFNINNRPTVLGTQVTLVGMLIALVGAIFIRAWLFMLLLGILASYGLGLAVGFWASLGILCLINLIFGRQATKGQ